MIPRRVAALLVDRLDQFPAVALIGPRQVGKTTLAERLAAGRASVYLDLEMPEDRDKLSDPALYLAPYEDRLVVLDEVHRAPDLFQVLRGLIDRGRRRGHKSGRFLILGSASMDLLRQSGESLAGRIACVPLHPLDVLEVGQARAEALWLRGRFPDSFLADSDDRSFIWRANFIRTYLERDIPEFGPRIPAETLRRLWTMLAHSQGGLLNAAQMARGLGLDGKTVARYIDLLVDLILVRRLPPFHGNIKKRLVKSPKVYVRDSGLVHALLGLRDREAVLGHPVAGPSWEGFVVETLVNALPERSQASFYRTAGGAEIDLILELPRGAVWAIEVKRSLSARPKRGFHEACRTLQPERALVVHAGTETYPLGTNLEAASLETLAAELAALGG